jgi:hypothetical protein
LPRSERNAIIAEGMTGIARSKLIGQLAGMVGPTRAEELLRDAAAASGHDAAAGEVAPAIVDRLAETSGAIGATVRLLRSRARQSQSSMPAVPGKPALTDPPPASGPVHRNVGKLVELLAAGLGSEPAAALVASRMAAMGLDRESLDRDRAIAFLEALRREGGVIGLAATFAKARAHLELVD